MNPSDKTHHACAIEIQKTGILIKGVSGSGKTSLSLGLLEQAQRKGLNAALIADDQVCLNSTSGKIMASAPKTINGLVEIRGYGIIPYENKPDTNICLVVEMIDDELVERLPEEKFISLEKVQLPLLEVPVRHENQAVRIVFAWLNDKTNLQVG